MGLVQGPTKLCQAIAGCRRVELYPLHALVMESRVQGVVQINLEPGASKHAIGLARTGEDMAESLDFVMTAHCSFQWEGSLLAASHSSTRGEQQD